MSQHDHEHGTTRSYVIGFILSLVFSLIPYFMVVHKTVSGNALLATILSFALAQMVIQITFFLHLGRGPKPRWNLFFFVATAGIILIVVGGSILIISNLHYNMKPSDQVQKLINDEGIYQVGGQLTGACQGQYVNHQITFKKGSVSPVHTTANKCDTLSFISGDGGTHKIAFGANPQHLTYAGETDLTVRKGENQTITLSVTGTYQFYDQSQPKATGDFTVGQ